MRGKVSTWRPKSKHILIRHPLNWFIFARSPDAEFHVVTIHKRKVNMPYCTAVGCNNDSKNKNPSISFHRVPLQGEIRKKWLIAIKRPEANLPKEPYLCSAHVEPHCFNESVDLQNELMGGKTKRRRELKSEAVPTKFAHKLTPKVRSSSVARAAKRKRKEVRGHFFYVLCCWPFCFFCCCCFVRMFGVY